MKQELTQEQKDFCKIAGITEDQFLGIDKIIGNLTVKSKKITSIPSGMKVDATGHANFSGCTGLTTLTSDLFNGANFGGDAYFYGCTGLTTLPSDLFNGANFGGDANFSGCTGLTTLPEFEINKPKTPIKKQSDFQFAEFFNK